MPFSLLVRREAAVLPHTAFPQTDKYRFAVSKTLHSSQAIFWPKLLSQCSFSFFHFCLSSFPCSPLFLSRSPSHHLTSSLPTLDTIIYFLSSIWSILKTKVKPKIWLGAQVSLCEVTGSGNRGGFAIIHIIASTWCKVNQATMQGQKGLISAVSRRAVSRASVFTDLPAVLGNRLCSSSVAALW